MTPRAGHRRRMLFIALALTAIALAGFAANMASPTEPRVFAQTRLVGAYALAGIAAALVVALLASAVAFIAARAQSASAKSDASRSRGGRDGD